MAIAFDAATAGPSGGAGPHTFAHTTTGSNLVLFVGVLADGSGAPTIAYNGVSMTQLDAKVTSGTPYTVYLFGLVVGAGVGAQNVVVTHGTGGTDMYPVASSYTGCSQSGLPDAHGNGSDATGSAFTIPLTTVADNCWMVAQTWNNNGSTETAGSGTINRKNNGVTTVQFWDSNGAETPAGSHTLALGGGGTTWWAAASVAPVAGGASVTYPQLERYGFRGEFRGEAH